MSQLARDVGITREGLYKVLSGKGEPSFTLVLKKAGAVGLEDTHYTCNRLILTTCLRANIEIRKKRVAGWPPLYLRQESWLNYITRCKGHVSKLFLVL